MNKAVKMMKGMKMIAKKFVKKRVEEGRKETGRRGHQDKEVEEN